MRRGELVQVRVRGVEKIAHWALPQTVDALPTSPLPPRVHLLSPFDPLVIQRKRLAAFFGYEHRFEAYVSREKRVYGYFALPVLVGEEIVAAIDLKADREQGRLLIQRWTWFKNRRCHRDLINNELDRFARFQFSDS